MKGTFVDFLQLVAEKPELAEQLAELAARFDFEFTDELSDDDLKNVIGGTAAPFIPGGAVLSAAITAVRKRSTDLSSRSGA